MDNSHARFGDQIIVLEHDRAEQRIEQAGIVTRTYSETRRVPVWVMLVVCGVAGDPLQTILSVIDRATH